MFCTSCGNKLDDDSRFCTKCGAKVVGAPVKKEVEKKAVELVEEMVIPVPEVKNEASAMPPIPPREEKKNVVKPSVQPTSPKKKSKLPIVIIILAIVIVLAGGIFAFLYFDGIDFVKETIGIEIGIEETSKDEKKAEETQEPESTTEATTEPTTEPTAEPTTEPTATPEVTQEPADVSVASTPSEAFDVYLLAFIEAINTGDTTELETILKEDSDIYNQQTKMAEYFYGQGITEELLSYSIKKTEVLDDGKMRIISDEEIEVTYADGSSKVINQSYAYTCVNEEGWLFTDMEEVEEESEEEKVEKAKKSKDYILPESDSRYYSKKEIKKLTKKELKLARNELFARYGYKFKDEELRKYFKSKSWYKPKKKIVSETQLNKFEKANLKKIQAREKKLQ